MVNSGHFIQQTHTKIATDGPEWDYSSRLDPDTQSLIIVELADFIKEASALHTVPQSKTNITCARLRN